MRSTEAMKQILMEHGLSPEVVLLDEEAKNTIAARCFFPLKLFQKEPFFQIEENARNSLAIIRKHAQPAQPLKVILVTSEFHSPRSECIFRSVLEDVQLEAQLEACPAPGGLHDDISGDPGREVIVDFRKLKEPLGVIRLKT